MQVVRLLAGNSFISLAGSEEQIIFFQQSPKLLKIVSENFIHALLLFLGLFLKISRWVPLLYYDLQLTTVKNTLVRHLGLIHDDFSHRVTDIWLPFATIAVSVMYVATVALVFILNSSIDLTTSQALVGEFTNSFYL